MVAQPVARKEASGIDKCCTVIPADGGSFRQPPWVGKASGKSAWSPRPVGEYLGWAEHQGLVQGPCSWRHIMAWQPHWRGGHQVASGSSGWPARAWAL